LRLSFTLSAATYIPETIEKKLKRAAPIRRVNRHIR
jgi:hypothetical protein